MSKKYEEIGDSEIARLIYSLSHAAVGGIGRVLLGYRAEGMENIPQEGPAIIACNHLLDPDVLFVPTAVPDRHVTVIGREGIMNRPVQGRIFKLWGARAIHRVATGETNREAMESAMAVMRGPLEENRLELIFSSPATRIPGKKPARPIGTITRLARETGAPVIPTVIKGSDRLLKNRGIVVKFGGAMHHPGDKKYDREFKKRINIAQRWLFDSIPYGYEYAEPDENIVLEPDV